MTQGRLTVGVLAAVATLANAGHLATEAQTTSTAISGAGGMTGATVNLDSGASGTSLISNGSNPAGAIVTTSRPASGRPATGGPALFASQIPPGTTAAGLLAQSTGSGAATTTGGTAPATTAPAGATTNGAGGTAANTGTATLVGIGGVAGQTSILRVTNVGTIAGAITFTVYDIVSGAPLGTATTAPLPARAGIELTSDELLAKVTPTLSSDRLTRSFNIDVSGPVQGVVQHLTLTTSGVLANATSCGPQLRSAELVLGNVEAPTRADLTGVVRMVNTGTQPATVRLALSDAATGMSAATWTSPAIPPHGQLSISVPPLAAAATPTLSAATTPLTIGVQNASGTVRLEHLVRVAATGTTADLTAGCAFGPLATQP